MPINRAFMALVLYFYKFYIGKETTIFIRKFYFPMIIIKKRRVRYGIAIKSQ